MKISLLLLPFVVFVSMITGTHAVETVKIDRKPLAMTGSWEIGQLMKLNWEGQEDSLQMVQRVSVWALQRATINERLLISLGLGGLFFNPYPTIIGQWGSQRKYFATGLSEVSGRYDFGDVSAPTVQLTLGYFPTIWGISPTIYS
ncbi:MAG: hypothetical protein M3Y08_09845 [Fibrobacterota bacterium]|nr:hypothetical protein [Fibrobacterota bacterium]